MDISKDKFDQALQDCAREPIHIPGLVQPHGLLFVCGRENWVITHASANTAELTGKPPKAVIGANLTTVLGGPVVAALEQSLLPPESGWCLPSRHFGIRLKWRADLFDVSVHEFKGRRIVELEPASNKNNTQPLDLVRGILAKMQQARTLADLCEQTVQRLRELIGCDRVMIYRFLQDGTGQVISESRTEGLEPYLHLRYPASDIPQQARELYKKSWVRLIADVDAAPCPIVPAVPAASDPIDLTYAALRSVSPIHIQYLKNMRVGASMSISIIVGGELWGLIACHHGTAKAVSSKVRAAAELLGQVFSLQIQTVEGIEAYVTMRAARALLDRVVSEFPVEGDLVENLSSRLEQIGSFIRSDGIGLWMDGVWQAYGVAPHIGQIPELAHFVDRQRSEQIFSTQNLAGSYSHAADWGAGICGMLAVPLSHGSGDYLFFFRGEAAQSIDWGGDPAKAVAAPGNGVELSPRQSFAVWKEDVRNQSLPWSSREKLIAETLRVYLLDIIVRFSEVILEERRQAELRIRLQASELNHRVKGTLELIQSLVSRGSENAGSVYEFVRGLHGRLQAIALAHDAISLSNGSEVRVLLETAFSAQLPSAHRLSLDGPETRLDAKAYTVLALVVHELVSNAVRHGALSTRDGHLSVRWIIDSNGRFLMHWEETGGPAPAAAEISGVGMSIVKRNIPHALGGEADVRFDRNGLKARFAIPQRYVSTPRSIAKPVHSMHRASPNRPLDGFSLLVVDDQILTAMELEEALFERGASAIDLAGTEVKALELLERAVPDAAILDVDLGDETSIALAGELSRRSIPFVFAATDADRALIPAKFHDIAIASKPYSPDQVADLLKEALMPHLIRAVLTKWV